MIAQRSFSLLLSSSVLLFVASTAHAQYKLEICEDLKITEAHYGINTVETATCVNPTKTFSPKGTLRNVNAVYSFPKVPTGAGVTFIGATSTTQYRRITRLPMRASRSTSRESTTCSW